MSRFLCRICGTIYAEEAGGEFFANLPESWSCPVCNASKWEFEELLDDSGPPAFSPPAPDSSGTSSERPRRRS